MANPFCEFPCLAPPTGAKSSPSQAKSESRPNLSFDDVADRVSATQNSSNGPTRLSGPNGTGETNERSGQYAIAEESADPQLTSPASSQADELERSNLDAEIGPIAADAELVPPTQPPLPHHANLVSDESSQLITPETRHLQAELRSRLAEANDETRSSDAGTSAELPRQSNGFDSSNNLGQGPLDANQAFAEIASQPVSEIPTVEGAAGRTAAKAEVLLNQNAPDATIPERSNDPSLNNQEVVRRQNASGQNELVSPQRKFESEALQDFAANSSVTQNPGKQSREGEQDARPATSRYQLSDALNALNPQSESPRPDQSNSLVQTSLETSNPIGPQETAQVSVDQTTDQRATFESAPQTTSGLQELQTIESHGHRVTQENPHARESRAVTERPNPQPPAPGDIEKLAHNQRIGSEQSDAKQDSTVQAAPVTGERVGNVSSEATDAMRLANANVRRNHIGTRRDAGIRELRSFDGKLEPDVDQSLDIKIEDDSADAVSPDPANADAVSPLDGLNSTQRGNAATGVLVAQELQPWDPAEANPSQSRYAESEANIEHSIPNMATTSPGQFGAQAIGEESPAIQFDANVSHASVANGIEKSFDQIADAAAASLHEEGRVVRLQLHPVELGTIEIQVTQLEHSIDTQIVASEAVTSDLLNGHREQLLSTLSQLGFESSDVDIFHRDDASSHPRDFPHDGQRGHTGERDSRPTSHEPKHLGGGLNIVA